MQSFINLIINQDISFFRYALIAGVLSSVTFGIIGSFVIVRRMSYVAGAISHSSLSGIGAALYINYIFGSEVLMPILGAFLSALISGIIIAFIIIYVKEREDTIIGIIWAIGMGLGLLLISKTPGYIDPMSYLFGNILLIDISELILILILNIAIIIIVILFYNHLLALSFDKEFFSVRGFNPIYYEVLLIILISLSVILMVSIVGIVMVIALLTIPAAIASLFTNKLSKMMFISSIICALLVLSGLFISYMLNLPSGSTTIVLAGVFYFIILFINIISKFSINKKL